MLGATCPPPARTARFRSSALEPPRFARAEMGSWNIGLSNIGLDRSRTGGQNGPSEGSLMTMHTNAAGRAAEIGPAPRLGSPYQPRPLRFIRREDLGAWRLKVYGIATPGRAPRRELVEAT